MSDVDGRPGFGTRLLALLVDYLLILGWMVILAAVAFSLRAITGEFFDWLDLGTVGAQLLEFALLVLPVGVYLYAGEASTTQATIGKRAMRLRVVDAAGGGRPSRSQILWRTVIKLLPWEVAHFAVWNLVAQSADGVSDYPVWLMAALAAANVLPTLYVTVVALQHEGRGPHDLVAGTRVITRSGS